MWSPIIVQEENVEKHLVELADMNDHQLNRYHFYMSKMIVRIDKNYPNFKEAVKDNLEMAKAIAELVVETNAIIRSRDSFDYYIIHTTSQRLHSDQN